MFADDTLLYVWNHVLFITPVCLKENVWFCVYLILSTWAATDSLNSIWDVFLHHGQMFRLTSSSLFMKPVFSDGFFQLRSVSGPNAIGFPTGGERPLPALLPQHPTSASQTKHISFHITSRFELLSSTSDKRLMVTNYRSLLLPHEDKKWIKPLKTTRCDVKTLIVFCNVSIFCCVSNTLPWKPKINQTEILFFPFSVHSSTWFLEIRKHFGNVFGYKIIDGIF